VSKIKNQSSTLNNLKTRSASQDREFANFGRAAGWAGVARSSRSDSATAARGARDSGRFAAGAVLCAVVGSTEFPVRKREAEDRTDKRVDGLSKTSKMMAAAFLNPGTMDKKTGNAQRSRQLPGCDSLLV